jgi:hypothetical protein
MIFHSPSGAHSGPNPQPQKAKRRYLLESDGNLAFRACQTWNIFPPRAIPTLRSSLEEGHAWAKSPISAELVTSLIRSPVCKVGTVRCTGRGRFIQDLLLAPRLCRTEGQSRQAKHPLSWCVRRCFPILFSQPRKEAIAINKPLASVPARGCIRRGAREGNPQK